MFNDLPSMEQAETYRKETRGMSPAVKLAADRILARMHNCGQQGRSVSIWDVKDILEDLVREQKHG